MAAANLSLPEYPREAIDGRQHLGALIDRLSRYCASNPRALDTAQEEDDAATADLFTEAARALDKDLHGGGPPVASGGATVTLDTQNPLLEGVLCYTS